MKEHKQTWIAKSSIPQVGQLITDNSIGVDGEVTWFLVTKVVEKPWGHKVFVLNGIKEDILWVMTK
jgi:hypothetical protein